MEKPNQLLRWMPSYGTYPHVWDTLLLYTLDNDVVTTEQRQFYEDNGYLLIKKLVSDEDIERFRKEFVRICNKEVNPPGVLIMRDEICRPNFVQLEKTVNKVHDFREDEELFRYCILPEILKYVECFIGPNIMAMQMMLINKLPDPGLALLPFRLTDRIVCSWTAMERANQDNGCLVVQPGTHKEPLKPHGYPKWESPPIKFFHGLLDYNEKSPRVHIVMEKGDKVFFHPYLFMAPEQTRHQVSESSECYYIDVKNTIQEHLEKEMIEFGQAKYKVTSASDLVDIWKKRAKVVQGERINL